MKHTRVSCDVGEVRSNSVHRTFVEMNQDIDTMKYDALEANALTFCYEHVSLLPDGSPQILTVVCITDDKAFVIDVDQYACRFCKGPLVYHMLRECPSFTDSTREGTTYAKDNIDPRSNPDMQHRSPTNLSPRQSVSS